MSERHVLNGPSNFMLVGLMNNAFGNPKGFSTNIDYARIGKQMLNVPNEIAEIFAALGADKEGAKAAAEVFKTTLTVLLKEGWASGNKPNLSGIRDGLSDVHVFTYGAHHLMGLDADADLLTVIDALMTRFIKNEDDKQATIAFHAARGVTDVYFQGEFPTMIMKSASDQPDAPKDKFLKSASCQEPVFKDPVA